MDILKSFEVFGKELILSNTREITLDENISTESDLRIAIDNDNVTVTLDYENNLELVKIEIFAFNDCTIKYYSDENTMETFDMEQNTSITFIYHNGWKHNGIYDAVWN